MLDRSFSYFCSCKRQCGAPLYLISQLEQMPRGLRNLKKKTRVMSQPIKTKPMATFRVSFPSLFAKAITHSPKVSWYFEKRKSFKSVGEFYSSKLFKEKRQHGLCISFSCFRQIISIWHSSFTVFIVFTADFFIFIFFVMNAELLIVCHVEKTAKLHSFTPVRACCVLGLKVYHTYSTRRERKFAAV